MLIFKDCTYSWENMDWYWTRSSIQSGVPSGKKTKLSSSALRITSRRRWSDRIPEIKRSSSERIWELSVSVWWNDDEQDGRKRRQQKKISILNWLVRTRNSLSPNSPRSFRTQSHWSYTAGQCVDSEQFLRAHSSCRMCNQFTLHKFRMDSGRPKFKQGKTDSILYGCESHGQGSQRSVQAWLDQTTSCMVQTESGKDTRIRCVGSIYTLLNEKDWSSIKQDQTQSSFTIHYQLIVSRKLLWWNLEKSFTRKHMYHLDNHRRLPSKIIGWKNGIQKSLEAAKTPNESNQNQKPNYEERGDPWVDKNPPRRSRKISCLVTRTSSTSQRTERPVGGFKSIQSCVSTLIKIEEEDQTRTERPVDGQESTKVE